MIHLNVKIFGLVQGVFFRASAKQKAEELAITGFARNEPDDCVYIEAEGEENNLQEFIDWCRVGPSSAQVKKVEVSKGQIKKFKEFSIE